MSELQQQAIRMISGLSDDDISFLIEIINRLMPQSEEAYTVTMSTAKEDRKMQAFKRLDAARAEISQYDGSAVPAVSPEEFLEVISDKFASNNSVPKQ